jgi:serine/threonine protein kinase
VTAAADLIAGRYRLVAQVGSGGMGVVWRATDEVLGRTVAIKELLAGSGMSGTEAAEASRRAMREARIAARLHHPNVIGVYDVVDHEGRPYLVMEFLTARSLADMMAVGVILPLDEVARIGARLASALAAAHDAGIVHRDVKPGNVLLSDDGAVKLADFGISSAIGDNTVTATGVLMGTPSYLAPEVASGQAADSRSDVYCLGATLYAAVEGKPPFGVDENAIALLYRVVHGEMTPPRNAGALSPVLMWMLERDPDHRPTMPQAQEALERVTDAVDAMQAAPQVIEAAGVPASPPSLTPEGPGPPALGRPERLAPVTLSGRVRRRAVVAGLAGVVLLATGILVAVAFWGNGSAVASPGASSGRSASPSQPGHAPTSPRPDSPSAQRAQSSTTSVTTAASSAAPMPAPTASQDLAGRLTATIVDYYRLMPGNLDEGWGWMTADYQQNHAGGRSGYQAFWLPIQRVVISDVTATPPATVEATINYYYKDGHTVVERTGFGLVSDQGRWKIATSSVLSR